MTAERTQTLILQPALPALRKLTDSVVLGRPMLELRLASSTPDQPASLEALLLRACLRLGKCTPEALRANAPRCETMRQLTILGEARGVMKDLSSCNPPCRCRSKRAEQSRLHAAIEPASTLLQITMRCRTQ